MGVLPPRLEGGRWGDATSTLELRGGGGGGEGGLRPPVVSLLFLTKNLMGVTKFYRVKVCYNLIKVLFIGKKNTQLDPRIANTSCEAPSIFSYFSRRVPSLGTA